MVSETCILYMVHAYLIEIKYICIHKKLLSWKWHYNVFINTLYYNGWRGRDRMVVGFTTTVKPVLRGHDLWDKDKVAL